MCVQDRKLMRGFTLIELLIVVAIIAILAAIAVPNFLEAQIRSKVSRSKGDFHALSIAFESYAVDNRIYPYGLYPDTSLGWTPRYNWGFISNQVTTPVAFMTSIPTDPFGINYKYGFLGQSTTVANAPENSLLARYRQVNARSYTGAHQWAATQADWDTVAWCPKKMLPILHLSPISPYYLVSPGPDKREDVMTPYNPVLYDPTNGTVSQGDLVFAQ